MSEMVERVARALSAYNAPNFPFENYEADYQDSFRRKARAAIEAMREPTEEMLNALPALGLISTSEQREYIIRDWQKMIAAALGETGK